MDPRLELRGDCQHCQGLCCVSLAFDRSRWFAFDKQADEPCQHLQPSNRCRMHARLESTGNGGCAHYDCYGAGQRVTRELFAGVSWREAPERAPAIFAAFRRLRDVHELRLLLHQAGSLPQPASKQARNQALLEQLEPAGGWCATTLAELDLTALGNAVHVHLRSLRPYVEQRSRRQLPLLR